jgi:hypothetical protein
LHYVRRPRFDADGDVVHEYVMPEERHRWERPGVQATRPRRRRREEEPFTFDDWLILVEPDPECDEAEKEEYRTRDPRYAPSYAVLVRLC